jgi:hypothetical protein
LICFFTTEWWNGEATSKVYHAEMVFAPNDNINLVKDISQEWPRVKITGFGNPVRKAVFRLKNKPQGFDKIFLAYSMLTIGQKYDWFKILAMALFWLFRRKGFARWIVRLFSLKDRDICSEYVAKFYQDYVLIPCSAQKPNFTAPDDILDYTLTHPEIFECILNKEGD